MPDSTQTDPGESPSTTTQRSTVFGVSQEIGRLPSGSAVEFGLVTAQDDYVKPVARFVFYDAFGQRITGASEIYIRMGGSFNSTLTQSYSPASGIFGTPTPGQGGTIADQIKTMFDKLSESAIGAIQKQIIETLAGGAGFLASAGLNAKGQIEFLSRKMINNYNQLLYQGANYRRFQLPFSLKPSNQSEALASREIIQAFRTASSPKGGNDVTLTAPTDDYGDINALSGNATAAAGILNDPKSSADAKAAAEETMKAYNDALLKQQNRGAYDLAMATDVLTFGYPDMCRFEILLMGENKRVLTSLFKSGYCVIESVSVDYGSGNKMNFFRDYHPTDVTMSLSLQEISIVTAGDATNYNNFIIQ